MDSEKSLGQEDLAENKEAQLKEKLLSLQLEYAQRLREGLSSPFEDVDVSSLDFSALLEQFTDLSTRVRDAYHKRTGKAIWSSDDNFDEFKETHERIVRELQDEYQQNPSGWIEKSEEIIERVVQELPEGTEPFADIQPEKLRAGVLRYEVGAGHGTLELEKDGIDIIPEDLCIKTHLDPLFIQEGIAEGRSLSELYEESYRMLAEKILQEYPDARNQIKAIVSESWLFSTDLVEKINKETRIIHTYSSNQKNLFRGNTFWGQFIGRNGEIRQDRVDRLFEGKSPFRIQSMYIPIGVFLDKYGPKQ